MNVVSQFQVPDNHSGATNSATTPDLRASGNADTPGHRCMLTDDDVMGNLDLVVELDAVADHGIVQGTSINRSVRSYLDVITYYNASDLRNL
jgi:hypothetical protein